MEGEYSVEATVHMPLARGYRVKIDVLELGLYLNGAVVFPNKRDNDDAWVLFPPSYKIGKGKTEKRFYPAEFDRETLLWQEMSEAAFQAVESYIQNPTPPSKPTGRTTDKALEDYVNDEKFDEKLDSDLDDAIKALGLQ